MIASINPATGETLRSFAALTDAELDARLDLAAAAYRRHRGLSFAERAGWLFQAAEILESEAARLGRVMTLEMGKPIRAARAEAAKCAWVCRYYAENAETQLAEEPVAMEAGAAFIRYQPLGPVLAVMPWNFPFWQVFRFAAPALMAGNVGLLKHASNVPQCALEIEDIFRRSGAPEGVFQTLLISSAQVARAIDSPHVAAVTLTGSEAAGAEVAARAGRQIKKTVLELGGSDAFIVMPSADLPRAAASAVEARILNNGQSCIAAKRFIVHRAIYPEFERLFVAGLKALKVGDPLDEATQLGPLATPEIRRELHRQVERSVELGARLALGGMMPRGPGNFYPATALADAPPGSPAYSEETFGPVASLFGVDNAEEAIRLANDTSFGLGASVWTRDPEEQRRFTAELEAGSVFVNANVASDPRLPFGGIKRSGYGRELSAAGIREFVNIKTVRLA